MKLTLPAAAAAAGAMLSPPPPIIISPQSLYNLLLRLIPPTDLFPRVAHYLGRCAFFVDPLEEMQTSIEERCRQQWNHDTRDLINDPQPPSLKRPKVSLSPEDENFAAAATTAAAAATVVPSTSNWGDGRDRDLKAATLLDTAAPAAALEVTAPGSIIQQQQQQQQQQLHTGRPQQKAPPQPRKSGHQKQQGGSGGGRGGRAGGMPSISGPWNFQRAQSAQDEQWKSKAHGLLCQRPQQLGNSPRKMMSASSPSSSSSAAAASSSSSSSSSAWSPSSSKTLVVSPLVPQASHSSHPVVSSSSSSSASAAAPTPMMMMEDPTERCPLRFLTRHSAVAWEYGDPTTGRWWRADRIGQPAGRDSDSDSEW